MGRRVAGVSLVVLLWMMLAVGGCSDRPASEVTVTDSASVRVTLTRDGSRVLAALDSVPEVSIGGPDADGPTQLSGIQGVLLGKCMETQSLRNVISRRL